jgi:hypothetical protein
VDNNWQYLKKSLQVQPHCQADNNWQHRHSEWIRQGSHKNTTP